MAPGFLSNFVSLSNAIFRCCRPSTRSDASPALSIVSRRVPRDDCMNPSNQPPPNFRFTNRHNYAPEFNFVSDHDQPLQRRPPRWFEIGPQNSHDHPPVFSFANGHDQRVQTQLPRRFGTGPQNGHNHPPVFVFANGDGQPVHPQLPGLGGIGYQNGYGHPPVFDFANGNDQPIQPRLHVWAGTDPHNGHNPPPPDSSSSPSWHSSDQPPSEPDPETISRATPGNAFARMYNDLFPDPPVRRITRRLTDPVRYADDSLRDPDFHTIIPGVRGALAIINAETRLRESLDEYRAAMRYFREPPPAGGPPPPVNEPGFVLTGSRRPMIIDAEMLAAWAQREAAREVQAQGGGDNVPPSPQRSWAIASSMLAATANSPMIRRALGDYNPGVDGVNVGELETEELEVEQPEMEEPQVEESEMEDSETEDLETGDSEGVESDMGISLREMLWADLEEYHPVPQMEESEVERRGRIQERYLFTPPIPSPPAIDEWPTVFDDPEMTQDPERVEPEIMEEAELILELERMEGPEVEQLEGMHNSQDETVTSVLNCIVPWQHLFPYPLPGIHRYISPYDVYQPEVPVFSASQAQYMGDIDPPTPPIPPSPPLHIPSSPKLPTEFFVNRPDGTRMPLIPLDDLPADLRLDGRRQDEWYNDPVDQAKRWPAVPYTIPWGYKIHEVEILTDTRYRRSSYDDLRHLLSDFRPTEEVEIEEVRRRSV